MTREEEPKTDCQRTWDRIRPKEEQRVKRTSHKSLRGNIRNYAIYRLLNQQKYELVQRKIADRNKPWVSCVWRSLYVYLQNFRLDYLNKYVNENMNWRPKPGEKNPNAKLNWSKVKEIRYKAEKGEAKKTLAKQYGVALRTISAIVKREYWREDGSPYIPSGFRW